MKDKEKSKVQEMLSQDVFYLCDAGITTEEINILGSPITPTFFNWIFSQD